MRRRRRKLNFVHSLTIIGRLGVGGSDHNLKFLILFTRIIRSVLRGKRTVFSHFRPKYVSEFTATRKKPLKNLSKARLPLVLLLSFHWMSEIDHGLQVGVLCLCR